MKEHLHRIRSACFLDPVSRNKWLQEVYRPVSDEEINAWILEALDLGLIRKGYQPVIPKKDWDDRDPLLDYVTRSCSLEPETRCQWLTEVLGRTITSEEDELFIQQALQAGYIRECLMPVCPIPNV